MILDFEKQYHGCFSSKCNWCKPESDKVNSKKNQRKSQINKKDCFENCHRSIFQSSLIRNLKCMLNCSCAVCHKAIIWMPTISPTFVELLSTWFRDDCNQNSRPTQVYTTIYAWSSHGQKTSSTRIKIINDCVADCWYCFIEWI